MEVVLLVHVESRLNVRLSPISYVLCESAELLKEFLLLSCHAVS